MRLILLALLMFLAIIVSSQTTIDFDDNDSDKRLYIRLYGHIDYNQILKKESNDPGILDVHRIVTLFGYKFSKKTQFVTEIEVEHAREIFVEQAFVKHQIARGIALKAGLLLIPMGMINEQHEPTFFYSVERPLVDNKLIPTTWREIGLGVTGLIPKQSLKYQIYLVNNVLGYDGEAKISAGKGFRSARQKGAKSVLTTFPALAGQLEYFGLTQTKIGLSIYHGKTNSSYFYDHPPGNNASNNSIDSSTITLNMATLHAVYQSNSWILRGQYTITSYQNADQYNFFTGSDVPELMHGFYLLAAYDFLKKESISFSPFLRFSHLNNQLRVLEGMEVKDDLKQNIYTVGLNYKPNPGLVFKIDFQHYQFGDETNHQQFNAGIGVWF